MPQRMLLGPLAYGPGSRSLSLAVYIVGGRVLLVLARLLQTLNIRDL